MPLQNQRRKPNPFRQLAAARGRGSSTPPPPARDRGGLLEEEGRPRLPAFPLNVFPGPWREWVRRRSWAGSSEDYIAQACWRPSPAVWPGRIGPHHPKRG